MGVQRQILNFHYYRSHFWIRLYFNSLSSLGPFNEKSIRLIREHCEQKSSQKPDEPQQNATTSSANGKSFTMVLPPPNVTGNLHIGHAITVAIEDSICRYQRLLGKRVRWVPGFDHAGIATQTIVENQLWRRLGKRREEFSDSEFLDQCEKWKNERIRDITQQLGSLGNSLDWPELFYTMDEKFCRAVKVAFCRLHSLGLIVRERRLVYPMTTAGTRPDPVEMEQWFLHVDVMNEQLKSDFISNKLEFIPPMNAEIASEFLKFKEPWNLSRQIIWGHRIPAYFVEQSNRWVVAESEEQARAQLTESERGATLRQDPDVLDTWFSSSLIPIVLAGWPDREIDGQCLDLMETGYDIVGHWVAKMLMLCHCLTGSYPFTKILLHGLVRDGRNRKMSKSLGNVIDPLDVIEGVTLERMVERMQRSNLPEEEMDVAEEDLRKRFPAGVRRNGVDAFRFALLSQDLTRPVIRMDFTMPLSEARNFCNRVWNLCKYTERVFHAAKEVRGSGDKANAEQRKGDEVRVQEKMARMVRSYHFHMQRLETHKALEALCRFIGDEVNNGYLENTKQSVLSADPERLPVIAETFRDVVSTSLGLLQPFLPYLCTFLMDTLDLDGQNKAAKALLKFGKNEHVEEEGQQHRAV